MDKKKIAIAVAAVVGVGALGLILLSHRASAQAQADSSQPSDASQFPAVLMSSAAQPSQIATGASSIADPTTGPTSAPDTSLSAIAAALAGMKSQTANNLFASLPSALGQQNLTSYSVSQTSPEGTTSLTASATYNPPPPPPPPKENHFFWENVDYKSSAQFIAQNISNYSAITGKGAGPEIMAQLNDYVRIANSDPRNQ